MSRLFAHLGIYYAHKPLNGGGVVVRKELAFALVEWGNFRHILGRESEVEYVEIFFHSFAADRFGYYNHPALNPLPSAKGPQLSWATPYFSIMACAAFCCWNTCVSTWFTAGFTSQKLKMSISLSG